MRPRPLHRPTRTTAAQNRPAACVPRGSAADRARLSDRAGRGVPPAGATALPAPSRLRIYRAASASFCRRTPPRQNSPDAASICLRHNTGQILPNPGPETELFQRIPKQGQDSEDSAEDAGNRAIELIMGQHQRSFRRLLQFISFYRNYNYFAVVDNKYHEIMLHHALTELYPKSHAGSSVIIHDVLLPRFEKLPFSELLAARGSDAFKEMRFVIKDIFHDISKYQDQPLKLSEFINDRLNHGKKHVEDAVRSSTYLSELRSDLGKFSIGVVVS